MLLAFVVHSTMGQCVTDFELTDLVLMSKTLCFIKWHSFWLLQSLSPNVKLDYEFTEVVLNMN